MRKFSQFVAMLSLVLATNSCASSSADSIPDTQGAQPQIDFTATLVDGVTVNLQAELRKAPVALWFWAPS